MNNQWRFPMTVTECQDCIHTLNMTVYVMTDIYDNRIIGIWSSEEKARKWLYAQVDSGAWTKGEAASVLIEAMRVV